jgi:cyclophilin family peptidyl-prolyl cis-trans isomerase/HEAT repeat protein
MPTFSRAFLCLMLGCVAPAHVRQEAQDNEAAARAEDAAIAAVPEAEALRRIRETQDARRDAALLLPWRRHPAPAVRAAVQRAWGLIGDAASYGPVVAGLDDADASVRAAAAFALGQLPTWDAAEAERASLMGQAEEALLGALGRGRGPAGQRATAPVAGAWPSERAVLLRALAEVGGEPAWDALIDGLRVGRFGRDEVESALSGLTMLARRGKGRALDLAAWQALLPHLMVDEDEAGWAVAALVARAKVADEARAQVVTGLLDTLQRSREPDRRAWGARALGKVGGAEAVPALRKLATDGARPLRERVGALRGLAAAKDVDGLAAVLRDPDPMVAEEGALGLAQAGGDAALLALLDWGPQGADAQAVRLGAVGVALGVGGLGDPVLERAASTLLAAVRMGEPSLRASAWSALGAHPDPTILATLLAGADTETDPGARLQLAGALGHRTEEGAIGPLLAWVQDPDPVVAAAAAEGLTKRTETAVLPRLRDALALHRGAADGERRLAVAAALLAQPGLVQTDMDSVMGDADPEIRRLGWLELARRKGASSLGPNPGPRAVQPWLDGAFGAGTVRGARVETSRGVLEIRLFPEEAPATVANFVALAERGFYDGLRFHRVVADFVVQGGDPRGDGSGGPGHRIRCELSPLPYRRGALGMALSGKDTGGSQWFLTLSAHPHLDGRYSVFGQLESGDDVLDRIRRGDRIEHVTILRGTP